MNRKPDGSTFTNDELFEYAVAHGANRQKLVDECGAAHSYNMIRSLLTRVTQADRFSDPTLTLDTRTDRF